MSGAGLLIDNKINDVNELKGDLWFELKTTNMNGEENDRRMTNSNMSSSLLN